MASNDFKTNETIGLTLDGHRSCLKTTTITERIKGHGSGRPLRVNMNMGWPSGRGAATAVAKEKFHNNKRSAAQFKQTDMTPASWAQRWRLSRKNFIIHNNKVHEETRKREAAPHKYQQKEPSSWERCSGGVRHEKISLLLSMAKKTKRQQAAGCSM